MIETYKINFKIINCQKFKILNMILIVDDNFKKIRKSRTRFNYIKNSNINS